MKRDFIRLLSLLILVIVLGACAKSEKDDWSPGEPRVEWDETAATRSFTLNPDTSQSIPGNARIVIPGAPLAEFSAEATCLVGRGSVIQTLSSSAHVTNSNSLSILDLLPAEVWKQLDPERFGEIACQSQFRVVNARGSSWNFNLKNLKINHLDRLGSFEFDGKTPPLAGKKLRYTLVCEKFRNARTIEYTKPFPQVMTDLLSEENPFLKEAPALAVHRLNQGIQTCRLAIEDLSGGGGRRALSNPYSQRFPDPKVEITAALDLGSGTAYMGFSLPPNIKPDLTIKIHNQSEIHVAYKLYDLLPDSIAIQVITRRHPGIFSVEDEYKMKFTFYSITGTSALLTRGSDRIFEIAPGQTATLLATIGADRLLCLDEYLESSDRTRIEPFLADVNKPVFVGYTYSFPKKRFLSRLLSWDPAVRKDEGPEEDAGVLQASQPNVEQIYPGWVPLQGWREVSGGERPREIRYLGNTHLTCTSTTPIGGALTQSAR